MTLTGASLVAGLSSDLRNFSSFFSFQSLMKVVTSPSLNALASPLKTYLSMPWAANSMMTILGRSFSVTPTNSASLCWIPFVTPEVENRIFPLFPEAAFAKTSSSFFDSADSSSLKRKIVGFCF